MCIKRDILSTLAYFDLFDYPITQTEIFLFLGNVCSHEEFISALRRLVAEDRIYQLDEFYSLQENYNLVTRRRKGNLKAKQMMETAEKVAGFLSCFPFVRGIAVSGSLSKNFADESSDIDLFIITASNKLWLARTFMHLFKKITFLFKKQDWFCMNYYIDEQRLQIKEKNIYTAIEVATLLPLRGVSAFNKFYAHNTWSKDYLPNHSMKISYQKEIKKPLIKKIIELSLSNIPGNFLDSCLMKIKAYKWASKTKQRKLNRRGCILSMDVNKHYAKPHPASFQNILLDRYKKKLSITLDSYETSVQTSY